MREPFFEPVSLYTSPIFCGDRRIPVDGPDVYIHWLGAILNPAHAVMLAKETRQPGSIREGFSPEVLDMVATAVDLRFKPGIHSDTDCEQGVSLRPTIEGPIGCRYAELRQSISLLTATRGEEIISLAKHLLPELFSTISDTTYAQGVVAASHRLATRDGVYLPGRQLSQAAIQKGAVPQVLDAKSAITERPIGIINLDPSTSLNNARAAASNKRAYVQDIAIEMDALWLMRDRPSLQDLSGSELAIILAVDTIGTMLALNIQPDDIAVRRLVQSA